jgi:chromosome segregation and condensation protein ScpB
MGNPYRRERKAAYGRSKERLMATLLAAPATGYTKAQLAQLCDCSPRYTETLLKQLREERFAHNYRVLGTHDWKWQRVAL